ncbi:uncharacterized protein IUM83_17720 [Phytophthora cinnamomi]|uniref:uncharacterized protein n=1 Tax=Phytophthora cinnamomi TaxID=4785 RepID=UPI003559CF3D|nr:hypothetical protein IUM83_17720 [Phytophthora cinnamomi]
MFQGTLRRIGSVGSEVLSSMFWLTVRNVFMKDELSSESGKETQQILECGLRQAFRKHSAPFLVNPRQLRQCGSCPRQ